ncbi:sugar metabolism global transcriptional regulator Mlc [Erwinia tasmaniensis]|uniref:Transcriptional regulator MLC (Making large colonies protein) n=1 Tax=Erwinia tasmaniensis (strain DSM 17950 / CFBP 7177 / CIP 109463 / NCPPB 4357 / Et1/99) TaxID=465817 RepID=B2VK04_ERWT9|nr:ROK family protein [Erwinia tasmaniensis]CAO96804.1 Transcriptional regulator MLC (Making large colonies protein) [Erwinia tasmaniensis Et1/99]
MITDNLPGHIDHIKQINAGIVYRLIDQYGPVSRIDLSKKAHLAPASITKIVRELLGAHLVQETEFLDAGCRGRPAVGLMLDSHGWHYLAVRIGNGDITLALRDLSSKMIAEQQFPLPTVAEKPLLARILQQIDRFFIQHQHQLERLTAIAITLTGTMNAQTGIVHSMPFYQVENMPLGGELEKRTGLSVIIQHDICAWTKAESLFGASREASDVIQVSIHHNVGAGVITAGQLLHGGRATLVEMGHSQVDADGKLCYCGNHGCLETVAGIDNVLELAAQRLSVSKNSILHHQPLTIDALCDAALGGDPLACEIIYDVGSSVGKILAVMVNLLHPQKILIGSPLNRAGAILFPAIASRIRQQALPAYTAGLRVESTQFVQPGTLSAAALVKEALYSGSLLIKLLQG